MMMFIKRVYFYMFLLAPSLWLVSGQDKLNIKQGGPLVIKVDTPPPLGSSILWKINANKVVEYDKDYPNLNITAYGTFKGRVTLDKTTGELKVISLTKADNGVYSVEYDSKLQPKRFSVSVFKTVPKPTITSSCDESHTSCTLTCKGNTTDAGEVAYSWKKGEQNLTDSQITLKVTSNEPDKFTCQLSNLVSEVESDPLKNPLHHDGPDVWPWLGPVLVIILLVIGLVCSIRFAPACKPVQDKIPFLQARSHATVPANVTTVYDVECGNAEGDGATTNTNNQNVIEVYKAQPSSDEVPLNTVITPDLHGNTEDRQDNGNTDTPTELTPLVGLPHEDVSNNTNEKGTGGETPINGELKDTETADDAAAKIKSSTSEVSTTAGNSGKGEVGSEEGADSDPIISRTNVHQHPSDRMESSQSYGNSSPTPMNTGVLVGKTTGSPKEDRPANDSETSPLKKSEDENKGKEESD